MRSKCRGLHYQSLCLCLQSLNFLHRGDLKKKKGKEGKEDEGSSLLHQHSSSSEAVCLPLAAAERGGHSLHPHAARLSLSLCHCLSLALSVSLSPRARLIRFSLSAACHSFSPFGTIFSAVVFHLPFTLSHTVIFLVVFLSANFYFATFSCHLIFIRDLVCPPQSPLEITRLRNTTEKTELLKP